MGFTAAGIAFDTVTNESTAGADDASQLMPLGFELTRESPVANEGMQTWIYVKAEGDLTTGMVVGRKTNTGTAYEGAGYINVIPCADAAPPAMVVGICVHAIGDNGYGFVMKKGICTVKAGPGTIDINEGLIPADDGGGHAGFAETTAAASDACFGFALEDGADNALPKCYVNCQG